MILRLIYTITGEAGMEVTFLDEGVGVRFSRYVDRLASFLDHADRVGPFNDYLTGLILPLERKSVEPIAARISPHATSATHQSLLHVVGVSPWSDRAVLDGVLAEVLPLIEASGGVTAWIVDDTSFPKSGRHSVGVARQYCGQLGKQDNCQVAVSLNLAGEHASLPIDWRLYLPKTWAADPALREKAKVPAEIGFATKPEISLEQIRAALDRGAPPGVVLADAGYGNHTAFRDGLSEMALPYVVGVNATTSVWAPGTSPAVPPYSGRGPKPRRLRRDPAKPPVSVKQLAMSLADEDWREVAWREGTNQRLRSRFARLRVRPAHRDNLRAEPRPEEWLLVEWPKGEAEPTKYWLATVAADTSLKDVVYTAKHRWRIERDYRELKQEVGLGHYEGRGWRGFHHHATLCIAAYGFLVKERLSFPPSADRNPLSVQEPPLPDGFRPRGAADPDTKARAHVNRHTADLDRRHSRRKCAAMPMLLETKHPVGNENVRGL
jgi:SRSO17 transposase